MALPVVLSTASFWPDTELGFRMAAELGYDGVEVMVNHDAASQTAESVAELSARHGMPVASVHVPCLAVSQHVWGFDPEAKLRRSVDLARAVGAGVVVTHPPFRWQRAYGAAFVDLVAELDGADGGPAVTVENMYTVAAFGRSVDPYLHNDDPAFSAFGALTLDTSHAAAAREDVLALADAMAGRVRHLHLSDSTATRGDEHLPVGMGTLPLGSLAAALLDGGFAGAVTLEVALGRLPSGTRTKAAADCRAWAARAFNNNNNNDNNTT